MQNILERINAEIHCHLINEYATAKEGTLTFKDKIVFPSTINESLMVLRNELLDEIDKKGEGSEKLVSILDIIDENSNLEKLVNFSLSKKEQDIYQELLSEDDGENASKLAEMANDKALEEYNDLLNLTKGELEKLYD